MSFYFLFILESIGTPELVLICVVALLIFGPRKLPQFGRTIGKYTAEFRRASQEFRETWEKEVQMEEFSDLTATQLKTGATAENTISRAPVQQSQTGIESNFENGFVAAENQSATTAPENNPVDAPAVREITAEEFNQSAAVYNHNGEQPVETVPRQRKRDWL